MIDLQTTDNIDIMGMKELTGYILIIVMYKLIEVVVIKNSVLTNKLRCQLDTGSIDSACPVKNLKISCLSR